MPPFPALHTPDRPLPRGSATASRTAALPALSTAMLLALSGAAHGNDGTDLARVISSVPVMQQVAVPRQVCTEELVTTPGQKSGAGALMGGIAGGAIGNQIGDGSGRAAATVLGIIGGAMLGNRIEGAGPPSTQSVQRCTTQTFYETRAVAYNVTYEYAGKQYTVQMPHDPGPTVRVQVSPLVSQPPAAPAYSAPSAPAYTAPVYTTPVAPPAIIPSRPVSHFIGPTTITTQTTYLVPHTGWVTPPPPRPAIWVNLSYANHPHRDRHPPAHGPGRHDWGRWR